MKYVYWFGYPILKLYWFLFRPKTYGVKGILQYKNELLLIRNSYGPAGWTFPGGGIYKHESLHKAVVREVGEEVGITVHEPRYIGHYFTTKEYKKDLVHCFWAEMKSKKFTIDNTEVVEAQWFPLDKLPPLTPSGVLALKVFKDFNT